jgi:hypothetical protein
MAATHRPVTFKLNEVYTRLDSAKKTSKNDKWWVGIITFDFAIPPRGGSQGTKWMTISYTDSTGVTAPFVVALTGEKHVGHILPTKQEDLNELLKVSKNKSLKLREEKKPAIQIQKWSTAVKTSSDGTVALKPDGTPDIPGDEYLSKYFRVAELLTEAFKYEVRLRIDAGNKLASLIEDMSKKSVDEILEEFDKRYSHKFGPRIHGYAIVLSDQINLRSEDKKKISTNIIFVENNKIAIPVQTEFSSKNEKFAGVPMSNPIARIAMNFNKDTKLADFKLYDKSKAFTIEVNGRKKQQYEIAKVIDENGLSVPVTADNVHKFILPRSIVDGIVNMNAICFSNLGISIPIKFTTLVVEHPKAMTAGLDDLYDDLELPMSAPTTLNEVVANDNGVDDVEGALAIF